MSDEQAERTGHSGASFAFPLIVAFVSGICGLVYEVAWMRSFTPVFGLSVHATTAVLVAFMAGLGLGSFVAPALIARWTRSLWLLYALIEVAIGATGILVPYATAPIAQAYSAVAALESAGALTGLLRFSLSMLVMMLPTFMMGTTLPVLAHACRSDASAALRTERVGLLYGLNTLGAACGCLIVGFVLLEAFGVKGTVFATALVNWSVAGVVLWRFGTSGARAQDAEANEGAGAESSTTEVADVRLLPSATSLLVLYGLIGATSFGYELIWFRVLVFYLQSATYSFSLMLAIYLMGIGLGAAVYARAFERRSVSAQRVLQTLALAQLGIALSGATALHIFGSLPAVWEALIAVAGAGSWSVIILQKALVAAAIILPPTFLMGISFPLMARLFMVHGAGDARVISRLYTSNTAGAIAGSLLTGFVLFDAIGIQPSLNLLTVTSLCVAGSFVVSARRAGATSPRFAAVAGALVLVAVGIVVATPARMLMTNFARYQGAIPFYRESASDITFVYEREGFLHLGFADGRGTSSTNPAHNYVNRVLAYSTMVVNPDAKNVLVISMGCGNTASAFAAFPIERLDIVDISSGPFEAAHLFETNLGIIDDPRVHTHVEDGRNFLLKTNRKYDVIQLELPSLHTDGVAFLYTREFYEIARSKLAPGGVLSQWIDSNQAGRDQSYRLIDTMLDVFPETSVWQLIWTWWAIGVNGEPEVPIDYERIRAVFDLPQVKADMARVNSSFEDTFKTFASYGEPLRKTLGTGYKVTDDQTYVDFLIPKLEITDAMGGGLGYYNTPLRELFRGAWEQDESVDVVRRPGIAFYTERRKQQRNRSLEIFARDFPEAERRALRR